MAPTVALNPKEAEKVFSQRVNKTNRLTSHIVCDSHVRQLRLPRTHIEIWSQRGQDHDNGPINIR